jgi:hypothetical protein
MGLDGEMTSSMIEKVHGILAAEYDAGFDGEHDTPVGVGDRADDDDVFAKAAAAEAVAVNAASDNCVNQRSATQVPEKQRKLRLEIKVTNGCARRLCAFPR